MREGDDEDREQLLSTQTPDVTIQRDGRSVSGGGGQETGLLSGEGDGPQGESRQIAFRSTCHEDLCNGINLHLSGRQVTPSSRGQLPIKIIRFLKSCLSHDLALLKS